MIVLGTKIPDDMEVRDLISRQNMEGFAMDGITETVIPITKLYLKQVWPEPNWIEELAKGRNIYVLSKLAVLYDSFPKVPRKNAFHIADEEWKSAFIEAAEIMKSIFDAAANMEDIYNIQKKFRFALGIKADEKPNLKERRWVIYYALGRGKKRALHEPVMLYEKERFLGTWLPDLGWPHAKEGWKCRYFPIRFRGGWTLGVLGDNHVTPIDDYPIVNREQAIIMMIEENRKNRKNGGGVNV